MTTNNKTTKMIDIEFIIYSGDNYCIVIKHHRDSYYNDKGEIKPKNNKWCIYVHTHKGHKKYDHLRQYLDRSDLSNLLHGGATYHAIKTMKIYDNDPSNTVIIGADYQHYGDEKYNNLDIEDFKYDGYISYRDTARDYSFPETFADDIYEIIKYMEDE